jgi:hypothetical protein
LDLKDSTIADGISEERMADQGIDSTLVCFDDPFASGIGESDSASTSNEIDGPDLSVVDQPDADRVGNDGTKLLHKIERECGTAIARLMVEPQVGIESDPDKGGDEILDEEGVEKGEKGIDGIARGPAITGLKIKGRRECSLGGLEHQRETAEVVPGGESFDPEELLQIVSPFGVTSTLDEALEDLI